jgi:hypothetical protein
LNGGRSAQNDDETGKNSGLAFDGSAVIAAEWTAAGAIGLAGSPPPQAVRTPITGKSSDATYFGEPVGMAHLVRQSEARGVRVL